MKNENAISTAASTILWKSLSRIISFCKHILIAAVIGLSSQLDIFYLSISIIGVLVVSWAGLFEIIAIPKMVKNIKNDNLFAFKRLCESLFTLSFLIALVIVSIFIFFPQQIAIVAPGLDNERIYFLVNSFYYLLPAIFLLIPIGVLNSILKSLKIFKIIFQIDFFANILILILIIYFINSQYVLFWSYSLSIIFSFMVLYYFVNQNNKLKLGNPIHRDTIKLSPLVPKLLILQSAQYLFVFVDRIFVSYLETGTISALAYATTLVLTIPSVIGVYDYFLSLYSAKTDLSVKTKKINDMISFIILLGIPATFVMALKGDLIVAILFERGAFSLDNTKLVYSALMPLSLIIIPLLLQRAMDQIYQVENKISLIVKRTIIGLILNIILNFLFIFYFKFGLFGVAFATSISNWLVLALSISALKQLNIEFLWLRHFKWFFYGYL